MTKQLDLYDLRRREVQALGAALSCRDWYMMEKAYNSLRDKLDNARFTVSGPPATPKPPAGGDEWSMVNRLRDQEADSVEILCDNPDGDPNNAIVCCGFWTGFAERRFSGDTIADALRSAVKAKDQADRDGHPDVSPAGGDAVPAGECAITGVQNDKRFNCFGIPDSYKGYAIHQGPDDLFYASLSAATWDELQDILDHPPAAPKPRAGGECLSSPDGRHQVDTSMESGSNNCFHCEAPMGGTNAR